MKISQWLGFNEESSQYLLKRGELRALINLHPRRPGMLVSRQGLIKLYGKYDDEMIVGMYRRDTLFGSVSDILCFQKVLVDRELSIAQIAGTEFPQELAWMVRRIQGNQERVIHQVPISPNGQTSITNFSVAEDRFGRIFMFFGHGTKPMMFRPAQLTNTAVELGLATPLIAPVVEAREEGYFLESVDVVNTGTSYWSPPTITVDGGNPTRAARVRGIVQGGSLVGIKVIDGGANYKTFPKIVIGSDKVGSGFKATGLLETDPGVQGFSGTTPGAIAGTAPTATQTVGSNNGLDGNRIMHLSAPVTATTRTVPQAATPTSLMTLLSVNGIGIGDSVTVYSGVSPAEFTSTSVHRVMAINEATKTVTLSKTWTPAANTSYLVMFKQNTSIGYANATWDAVNRRFTATVPLINLKGVGTGAEATLTLSPMAYSYGLGSFTMGGYTVPATASYGYREVGWENYINDEYWQGSFQDKANSKENSTYAGLQASGASYVYGFSGTISPQNKKKTTSQRADVYWPDYSSISVWLCEGLPGSDLKNYTRVDAKVYEDTPGQPYALVTLRPAAKQATVAKSGRSGKQSARVSYTTSPDYRPPVVRINLRSCPDTWVTDAVVNGNYNLPTSTKESRGDRQKWWHTSGVTPRPVVDFRGSGQRYDSATIEVIDPGAGWERGTTFSMRIHQANPYNQRVDYNVAVREQRISGGHAPFSQTSRFAEFVFQATTPDNLTPAGPPSVLAGNQYVDVGGTGYRTGDQAVAQLLRRDVNSPVEAPIVTFDAIMYSDGQGSEFTYVGGVQQPGARIATTTYAGVAEGRVTAGMLVECEEPSVLLPYTRILQIDPTYPWNFWLDKMRNPAGNNAGQSLTGSVSVSSTVPPVAQINFGTTPNPWIRVGQRLWDGGDGKICTITSISVVSGNTIAVVSGQVNTGTRTYLALFRFTARAAVVPSQTVSWTAENILAGTGEQRVTSIRIISGGRNYYATPTVLVRGGGNGYGLSVRPTVSNGQITSVEILDPGRAYTAQPELFTDTTPATAVPVMRPTMRGVYRCAYRFVDRSETIVLSTAITGVRGDAPTSITLASVAGIEPGMILESARLPSGTKVVSLAGDTVELNQEATGEGKLAAIVIENGGVGYSATESITCTIAGATGYVFSVSRRQNESGSYSVNGVAITTQGTALFSTGKVPVICSPPATGGTPATGYAYIMEFSTASSYDKSVVVRDLSKPVSYSSFSPIVDVDAGPNEQRQHSSEIRWSLAGVTPPTRADRVELWRTSADQSLVFYRLEAYGRATDGGVEIVGADTLSDEELFDPERPNYAAMPVVLPNGNLNAYRFGQPRSDMAVCVAFQDRLWYGVSTSGKDANTLFYSEFDEFESCPDTNDLPIQQNQRATDSITALVPFGSMLLAMQHLHTYAITYNTDPGVDASIQMMSHRGALHQRCHDIHENIVYAADEQGIYALSRSGEIAPISDPIRDYFNSELIDFSKRESFFLTVCPRTSVLRFFCCMVSQPEETPTMALCYDIQRKTWWTERYPNSLCSAVAGRPSVTRINSSLFGGVDGNIYELLPDKDHTNQTLIRCEVRDGGSGYRRSPRITCPNSKGVQVKGVVSEGRLVDVLVYAGGWDCKYGVTLEFPFSGNWKAVASHDNKPLQGVEYAPIQLDIEGPELGGTQAVAVGHFSVTTRLVRDVTVAAGESFVRLSSISPDPILFPPAPLLAAEDGRILACNDSPIQYMATVSGQSLETAGGSALRALGGDLDGVPISTEQMSVEIGMEAIGDFLPLNCFVSKIVGQDIYLVHADGTPVTTLGGAPRTDSNGDGFADAGGTQTLVYFRKPYYSHIPFRLATGALQIANEDLIQKGGDGLIDKSISLLYTPTEHEKEVEIIEFFNDSQTPRPNVMRRSRGGPGSFEHRQDSASTVLNLARGASHLGDATGVATATFASRVYTDATGEDQHVQVELYGRPGSANTAEDRVPQKFVLHSMTIQGVMDAE